MGEGLHRLFKIRIWGVFVQFVCLVLGFVICLGLFVWFFLVFVVVVLIYFVLFGIWIEFSFTIFTTLGLWKKSITWIVFYLEILRRRQESLNTVHNKILDSPYVGLDLILIDVD